MAESFIVGPGYLALREMMYTFDGVLSEHDPRWYVTQVSKMIFSELEKKEISSVECITLLDLLSISLSFSSIGRGVFSRGGETTEAGGIFGRGDNARKFRTGAAKLILSLGFFIHGKTETGDDLEDMYNLFRDLAKVSGDEEPGSSAGADSGIDYAKRLLDFVAGGFYASKHPGRERFRNGPMSLFMPYMKSSTLSRGFDPFSDPSAKAAAVLRSNEDPEAADSRMMSLLLDFLKDDEGCDMVEIMVAEKAFEIMEGETGKEAMDAAYSQYKKYCDERVGAISESVRRTGIDICDYGDFPDIF